MKMLTSLLRVLRPIEKANLRAKISRRAVLGGALGLGTLAACSSKKDGPKRRTKKQFLDDVEAEIKARGLTKKPKVTELTKTIKCKGGIVYTVTFGIETVGPEKGYQGRTYKKAIFDVSIVKSNVKDGKTVAEVLTDLPDKLELSLGENITISDIVLIKKGKAKGKLQGTIEIDKAADNTFRKLTVSIDGEKATTENDVFKVKKAGRIYTPPPGMTYKPPVKL